MNMMKNVGGVNGFGNNFSEQQTDTEQMDEGKNTMAFFFFAPPRMRRTGVYLDASRLLSDAGNWIENRPRLGELGDTAMAEPTKKAAATMCDIMQGMFLAGMFLAGMFLQPVDPCEPDDPCISISQIQLARLYLNYWREAMFFFEFETAVMPTGLADNTAD